MKVAWQIAEENNIHPSRIESVAGGDINQAYRIVTGNRHYFLKTNSAVSFPAMLQKEAAGLALLKRAGVISVPAVIAQGQSGSDQYLILEWVEKGIACSAFWEKFGSSLALLHQISGPYFGLTDSNYIGSLHQCNDQQHSWSQFYAQCRVMPLIKALFDNAVIGMADMQDAENFCRRSDDFFPAEQPSLLHGDLWSGNFLVNKDGLPVIFDPAVYYGHREMDIGMSLLFGGFDKRFYAAYQEAWPLQPGWQQRVQIAQLYPLLVHAVLFGGHYIAEATSIIRKFR